MYAVARRNRKTNKVTITYSPPAYDYKRAYTDVGAAVDNCKRLNLQHGGRFEYVVVEFQGD